MEEDWIKITAQMLNRLLYKVVFIEKRRSGMILGLAVLILKGQYGI
jgi:hypothetical protein